MDKKYCTGIIVAALLMMLAAAMAASAEPNIAPAGGSGDGGGSGANEAEPMIAPQVMVAYGGESSRPEAVAPSGYLYNKMQNTERIIENCSGCSEDTLRKAIDILAKTNPDDYIGYDDYNQLMELKPWEEPLTPTDEGGTITLPVEDNLILDPPEITLPVITDPPQEEGWADFTEQPTAILPSGTVIEPPQDPGNDIGPCVIGTQSPCNDPKYWLPERWDWIWMHRSPPLVTIPEPPDLLDIYE